MDRLEQMLSAQMQLQARLGIKFAAMTTEERVDMMRTMALAAVAEVMEALDEVTWKPWSSAPPAVNVTGVASELNDVWQFVANMWFLAMPKASPAEIADTMHMYLTKKIEINHARVTNGYDGTNKCPGCRRAYDDTYVTCIEATPQMISMEQVPAFCDQRHSYVSQSGDNMALGSSGWYVVTP